MEVSPRWSLLHIHGQRLEKFNSW